MNTVITIVRFSPHTPNFSLLASLIECYRDVFAEAPWHEWLKCQDPQCEIYWGKNQSDEIARLGYQHCGKAVVDYWSHESVLQDLKLAIIPNSSCWIALETQGVRRRVVGFTWGSPLQEKWKSLEKEGQEALEHEFGSNVSTNPHFVYQLELGVRAEYRGQGIARRLIKKRHEDFLERGYTTGILKSRLAPEPSVTYLWYRTLGYKVIHQFENGKVVMAGSLIPNLFD